MSRALLVKRRVADLLYAVVSTAGIAAAHAERKICCTAAAIMSQENML